MKMVWARLGDAAIALSFLVVTASGADLRMVLIIFFALSFVGQFFKAVSAVFEPVVDVIKRHRAS